MLRSILIIVAVVAFQATPAVAADRTIVVLGDSLSSGYGIAADESWVPKQPGHHVTIVPSATAVSKSERCLRST